MLVSRLFTSATPPRIAAARRPHLLVLAVEHVLEATRIHEHATAVKRGKPSRLLGREGRDLLEEAVNGPPHKLAHRAVLLAGHGPEPLHHRVREKNLNLLHGSML
jgi:hypothetical protein